MPLHEYLEQKRRRNIAQLNASGACHICGSTCRNSRGFRHFMDGEEQEADEGSATAIGGGDDENNAASASSSICRPVAGNYSECSMVRPPDLAAMRTCACFGISPDDPDYWPYSLRVCDKCIEEDRGIGRIRSCGVCGTVACDENCGAELLECTDVPEWNNAGCLECRRPDFSEMEIFRNIPPQNHGEPRITRICAKCLEQSTPWVKYDFACRRFRCQTRLVPSDVAERKRFRTFGSSPLNLLPEDGLVAVVDFLGGGDLKRLFLTCSAMCTVAERVAKEKVARVNSHLPTGPIVNTKRKDGVGQNRDWTHLGGTNDFGLRAPDDDKAWVGVYHYVEKIAGEAFFFAAENARPDLMPVRPTRDVVERFLNEPVGEKFSFGSAYAKVESDLVEAATEGLSVRGGCVLVTGAPAVISPNPVVIRCSQSLEAGSGIQRVIFRLFVPGSGGARGNRDAQNFRLGSIGLLRTNSVGEGPTNAWAQRQDVMEGWVKEDVIFGLRYDSNERELVIHGNANLSRSSRYASNRYTVADAPGDLYIAAELAAKGLGVVQTLLTARHVNEDEWERFVATTTVPLVAAQALNAMPGAEAFDLDAMDAMEIVIAENDPNNNGGAGGEGNADIVRLEEQQAQRNEALREARINQRRRDRADDDDEDEEDGNLHRIQARAVEGGRHRFARMLMPRQPAAQAQGQAQAQDQLDGPHVAAAAAGRRVIRALRPFARATARREAPVIDLLGDDDMVPMANGGLGNDHFLRLQVPEVRRADPEVIVLEDTDDEGEVRPDQVIDVWPDP